MKNKWISKDIFKTALITLVCVNLLVGCSLLPINGTVEEGYAWCNARYLDVTNEIYRESGSVNPVKEPEFRLAQEGYMYALASALVLQKEGKNEDKHFKAPKYMQQISFLNERNFSGFEASTFLIYDPNDETQLEEVVVAFSGTDSWWDWFTQNLNPSPLQNSDAQNYVNKVLDYIEMHHTDTSKEGTPSLIVAGFSLGGGLAMHVLHNDSNRKIAQAWAFNSSPRTGHEIKVDNRLYLASTEGEILSTARGIRKGSKQLGALEENYTDDFNLINASSFYLHSRWVLTREMLIYADMLYYEQSKRKNSSSPALEILKSSAITKGCTDKYRLNVEAEGRL